MNHEVAALPYRVRLYWSDVEAALAQLRDRSAGAFRATLDGNFPAIECEEKADADALLAAFRSSAAPDAGMSQ